MRITRFLRSSFLRSTDSAIEIPLNSATFITSRHVGWHEEFARGALSLFEPEQPWVTCDMRIYHSLGIEM